MSDTQSTAPPGNPFLGGLVGIGLLITSLLLSQSREPIGLYILGRFLFVAGLAAIGGAVYLWYRQTNEPEQEREPEV